MSRTVPLSTTLPQLKLLNGQMAVRLPGQTGEAVQIIEVVKDDGTIITTKTETLRDYPRDMVMYDEVGFFDIESKDD